MENFDFSGWATKANLKCSDGRTIMKDAFKDNDGARVPLVWNHQHDDPEEVLGHAILENREEGVYAYCKFNDNETGKTAKELVRHGDVNALSIYANQLRQDMNNVIHGNIREVSLVLAGANPGAFIDSIMMHGEERDDEGIIYTGETIELAHADRSTNEKSEKEDEKVETTDKAEKTVADVFDELTEEQKTVVYAMIGQVLEDAGVSDDDEEKNDSKGGTEEMKHNVFENENNENRDVLSHDAMNTIIGDAKRYGSMKDSFFAHAAEYGISNIDYLFPEAKDINGGAPEFIKRTPDAWVDIVLKGVHHTPFSRIKSMFADITADDARAKGYTKGNLKKEEVFGLLKRSTNPTTIYKKQKMDRDDVVDITDFDVIAWLKAEMRTMLDEEIARAILFGDGRNSVSDDKISEDCIRPVLNDTTGNFYAMEKVVTPESGEDLGHAIINAVVRAQDDYQGSGNITLFTAASTITDMLLLEDAQGHRLYKDISDLALAMNINKIVKVPASVIPNGYYGVALDLSDYNVGADKGGSVNMFDDFDIDYNQQKYLIETRCSGALVKPYSAIVLKADN